MKIWSISLLILTICITFIWFFSQNKTSFTEDWSSELPLTLTADDLYYYKTIQPLLNSRCVVCHGCYSSPCQLNMQGPEGVARGAHLGPDVYNPSRLSPITPTRLTFDAQSTQEWQSSKFNFFDVLRNGIMRSLVSPSPADTPHAALLLLPRLEKAARVCPRNINEVSKYLSKYPEGKMPYGLTPMSAAEQEVIFRWLDQGAKVPEPARDIKTSLALKQIPTKKHSAIFNQIQNWNRFFNHTGHDPSETRKFQIVSRYLYEHLYLAHLFFKEAPEAFFRIARSTTSCETEVKEFNARRANELPPEVKNLDQIYYCLVPMNLAPVEKNHMPYLLSEKKLARFQELFFSPERPWQIDQLPTYQIQESSNPFKTFRSIPAFARYQFLLDDAEYHVSTFIKGPVCYGNGAINAIQEQAYVFFIDPDSDPLARPSRNPTVSNVPFYDQVIDLMDQPAKWADMAFEGPTIDQSIRKFTSSISRIKKLGRSILAFKKDRIQEIQSYKPNGLSINDIWNGENGQNDNAVLTVFRNSESASVVKGARGDLSKTINVLDYALFERIVYDLVVNFNVFDSIELQALARIYKGFLRIDEEDLFLNFLPKKLRSSLRSNWYRGIDPETVIHANLYYDYGNLNDFPETAVPYSQAALKDPEKAKQELIEMLLFQRFQQLTNKNPDWMNWKSFEHLNKESTSLSGYEQLLTQIAGIRADQEPFSLLFPDHAILEIIDSNQTPLAVFSILRNKEILSPMMVTSPILANSENSLVILKNIGGLYPNLFFRVVDSELSQWIQCIRNLKPFLRAESFKAQTEADWKNLLKCNGVAKNDINFWKTADEIHRVLKKELGNKVGILDFSRYGFPDSIDLH